MKKYNLGFIGYGNMAQAISSALVSSGAKEMLKAFGYKISIAVSDPDSEKLALAPSEIVTTSDNEALVNSCDFIIVAVKPQVAKEVLSGLCFANKTVLSIMASVSISALDLFTGKCAKTLIRVMPNLNARIGASYSTFCMSSDDDEARKLAIAILSAFGEVKELNEDQMNISTGLCGSGPAFVFKFINAFYENARSNGISDKTALNMALSTVLGSVSLVLSKLESDGEVDISELVKSVCSKGGTTIQGVNYLDEMDFESIVSGAINRAIARAEEMSKDNDERG